MGCIGLIRSSGSSSVSKVSMSLKTTLRLTPVVEGLSTDTGVIYEVDGELNSGVVDCGLCNL